MHTRMYLPDTKSMVLQTNYGNEQYNTLNINGLMGYCATNNPFKHTSASVSVGLFKTCLGASTRHLVGLSCLCVLKSES